MKTMYPVDNMMNWDAEVVDNMMNRDAEEGYSHPMDWEDYSTDINQQTKTRMKDREKGKALSIEEGLTHRQRIK